MYFAVYITAAGKLAVRNLHTRYESTAISECREYRLRYDWQAYRLFFEDGYSTACVASWGEWTDE